VSEAELCQRAEHQQGQMNHHMVHKPPDGLQQVESGQCLISLLMQAEKSKLT
jgi:hypothetical protein